VSNGKRPNPEPSKKSVLRGYDREARRMAKKARRRLGLLNTAPKGR